MQSAEQSWADVDGEEEMVYDSRPGLLPDLGPKLGALKMQEEQEMLDSDNPIERKFYNNLPNSGPYRIMITNLPKTITKESLTNELTTKYKITATIQFKEGSHFCFLKFTSKHHCLETTSLFGKRIHGSAVQLKVNPAEQQAEIRRANTARNTNSKTNNLSGSTGRFKNLARDGASSRGEVRKHRHPVGGSIRKKRTGRNTQSSSQTKPTNPWGRDDRDSGRTENFKILGRNSKPSSGGRFGGRSSGLGQSPRSRGDDASRGNNPPRRNDRVQQSRPDNSRRFNDGPMRRNNDSQSGRRDMRDDRREVDRRDNSDDRALNFRNRRKLRDEDGRADENMNWRNSGNNAPARGRMTRGDPTRSPNNPSRMTNNTSASTPEPSKPNFSRRAVSSGQTTQRKIQNKEKEAEAQATKRKTTNKFAAFLQDDDE